MADDPTFRHARVLASDTTFAVSDITSSNFKVLPENDITSIPVLLASKNEGIFRKTGSIKLNNFSTNPVLDIASGPNALTQSLNLAGTVGINSLTASNTPNNISFTGDGLSKNDFVWRKSDDAGLARSDGFYIEQVLDWTGSHDASFALGNSAISSGSTFGGTKHPAPFFAPVGNDDEDLPGCVFSFRNIFFKPAVDNYIKWASSDGSFLEVKATTPIGGADFFTTYSFSIPYAVDTLQGQECYVYLFRRTGTAGTGDWNGRYGPIEFRALASQLQLTGSLTGSFIIPGNNDLLIEGEKLELRVESESPTKPFTIGFFSSSQYASITIENTYNADKRPRIYLGTTQLSASEFTGTAWGAYAGSLGNVSLSDIPVSKALYRGNGLVFLRAGGLGYIGYYRGTLPVTASLRLSPSDLDGAMPGGNTSGFTYGIEGFPANELTPSYITDGGYDTMEELGYSYGLALTSSLAGTGLSFGDISINGKRTLSLLLSGSDNSGLTAAPNIGTNDPLGLRVRNSLFESSRFTFQASYSASVNINSNNPISKTNFRPLDVSTFGNNKLVLNTAIPGFGLRYKDTFLGRNVLQVQDGAALLDDLEVVSSSLFTQLKTTGIANSPLRFGRSFLNTNQNSVDIFYTGSTGVGLINRGRVTMLTDIPKPRTIQGTVLVKGNFTTVNNDKVTNLQVDSFSTTDDFMVLNSGSNGFAPYSKDTGGFIIQTSADYSGSSVFHKGTQGGPTSFDNETFDQEYGWWALSQTSSVAWNDTNVSGSSDPVYSLLDSPNIRSISTVKSGDILNPNSGQTTAEKRPGTVTDTFLNWSNISNLEDGNSGDATTTTTNAFVTCSNFSFNVPSTAAIKGIYIQAYAKISSGTSNIRFGVRLGSTGPFTIISNQIVSNTSYQVFTVGDQQTLFGLDPDGFGLGGNQLQLAIGAGSLNSQTFSIAGFNFGFPLESPQIQLAYNTEDQENSIHYSPKSVSKYGSIFVNSGADPYLDDSNVWTYVTE